MYLLLYPLWQPDEVPTGRRRDKIVEASASGGMGNGEASGAQEGRPVAATAAGTGSGVVAGGNGNEAVVESVLGKIGGRRVDDVAKLRKSDRFQKQLVGTSEAGIVGVH